MASSLVQVRVDEKIKSDADQIFERLGIDLPTAVRIFLARAVMEKGIPFSMKLPTQAPSDIVDAMKATSAAAENAGVADMTLDEINAEIALVRSKR